MYLCRYSLMRKINSLYDSLHRCQVDCNETNILMATGVIRNVFMYLYLKEWKSRVLRVSVS